MISYIHFEITDLIKPDKTEASARRWWGTLLDNDFLAAWLALRYRKWFYAKQ